MARGARGSYQGRGSDEARAGFIGLGRAAGRQSSRNDQELKKMSATFGEFVIASGVKTEISEPKGNGDAKPPADQRADLGAALARIAEERVDAQKVLDGLESRRECLLLADAPESEILALDCEADSARIRLEKLDVFEIKIAARLDALRSDVAESEWRDTFARRYSACLEYAAAVRDATEKFRSKAPTVFPESEILQKFLLGIERASDFEMSRRACRERERAKA